MTTARLGNLRDLGELSTTSGRIVRPGVLLRSGAPDRLTAEERQVLRDVVLVFDLQAPGEAVDGAHDWDAGEAPEVVRIPLIDQHCFGSAEVIRASTCIECARAYKPSIYADILDELRRGGLRTVASHLGAERRVPVLIHCTGGQDRTGLLVAVLLLALGVQRELVVADYVRSVNAWNMNRLMEWVYEVVGRDAEPREEAVRHLLARPEHLEGAIDALLAEHGSIEQYWASAGVDADGLEQLRSVLLTPPG